MAELESYLRNEFQTDVTQRDAISETIMGVMPIFEFAKQTYNGGAPDEILTWPYAIKDGTPETVDRLSVSTHCMIVFALDSVLQGMQRTIQVKDKSRTILFPKKIFVPKLCFDDSSNDAWSELLKQTKLGLMKHLKARTTPFVISGTYGDDDPLTLTWISELILRDQVSAGSAANLPPDISTCRTKLIAAAEAVCSRGNTDGKVLELPGSPNTEIPNCFLWLRCLHLAKLLEQIDKQKCLVNKGLLTSDTFERELHRQIGLCTIPDSRFDPASLAFALEGVLTMDPHSLSDGIVDRCFKLLEKSQEIEPFWRPVIPFLATPQGMALFPVSVEVANSLLRTYEILRNARREPHMARIEGVLRRYVTWILARKERVKVGDNELLGWPSEHVNELGLIHLWQTSQVLLFLVHYASLLQQKISAESLAHARLKRREPQTIDPNDHYWMDEPLTFSSDYEVLGRVKKRFIEARKSESASDRDNAARSILLYGPPGTGKTTLAEQLAVVLSWPLIIITVSDFLADGAAEVEARAQGVFKVLMEQDDAIVLFDEIDQFLLDRNSRAYQEQTGIFQFLTPGMLNKFQDLSDAKRNIFIVATNYEDHIDGAIKRQGRFDEQVLLSLPDKRQRTEFLWLFVKGKLKNLAKNKELKKRLEDAAKGSAAALEVLDAAAAISAKDASKVEAAKKAFVAAIANSSAMTETPLFGFGDIKYLVTNYLKLAEGDTWSSIADRLSTAAQDVQPSVRLDAYRNRFSEKGKQAHFEQSPYGEFVVLLYLVGEAEGKLREEDIATIEKAIECLPSEIKNFKSLLRYLLCSKADQDKLVNFWNTLKAN